MPKKLPEVDAVCIADVHCNEVDSLGISHDGINSRLKDKLRAVRLVVRWTLKKRCKRLFVLGDLFHSPDPSSWLRAAVGEVLGPFVRDGGWLYFVNGNHDGVGIESPFASEAWFSDRVVNVVTPAIVHDEKLGAVVCLPDCGKGYDENTYAKLLKQAKREKPRLLVGHGPLIGAVSPTGFSFDRGFNPTLLEEFGAKFGVFGDIHKRQWWRSGKFNYGYVGSLVRQDFGERSLNPGFVALRLRDSKRVLVKMPDRPMVQVEAREGQMLDKKIIKQLEELHPRPLVKLVLHGKSTWVYSDEVQRWKRKIEARALKVQVHVTLVRETPKLSLELTEFSVDNAFRAYAARHRIKSARLKCGHDLLSRATRKLTEEN